MKILLIHHVLPYPLRSGWDKTLFGLANVLNNNFEFHLLCPVFNEQEEKYAEEYKSFIPNLHTVRINKAPEKTGNLINQILVNLKIIFGGIPLNVSSNVYPEINEKIISLNDDNRFDIIQLYSTFAAGYIDVLPNDVIKILGPIDDEIETANNSIANADTFKKRLSAYNYYYSSRRYFKKVFNYFDFLLFHSKDDLRRVSGYFNIMPVMHHCPTPTEYGSENDDSAGINSAEIVKHKIVFVGGLEPFFNQDAVKFFYNEILPILLEKYSDLVFYVIGRNPNEEIKKFASKNVIVTGEVSDEELSMHIKEAEVYILPIRTGVGIKTKLIEALRYGKAIVTTSVSVKTLYDFYDESFLVADDKKEFANKIAEVFDSKELRLRLEENARKTYNDYYSVKVLEKNIVELYKKIGKKIQN